MPAQNRQVLVFHRATGFVHRSIPHAVAAIEDLGARYNFGVASSDDPDRLLGDDLPQFGVVVLVHTSGDVLPDSRQRLALERYVTRGGGVLAVHAAAAIDAEVAESWPWYRRLIGAALRGHTATRIYCDTSVDGPTGTRYAGPLADAPPDAEWISESVAITSWEPANVRVEDPGCPAIAGICDGEIRADEWYGFDDNPRGHVHVVATVDESTYDPAAGAMGPDHPIVWWQDVGAGRSVYNSMGHSVATWEDASFLRTIAGGIAFAARWANV
jgi:hypothetical protein